MFAHLNGKIVEINNESIVIDINGIGYRLYVPPYTGTSFPPVNEKAFIHTSYVIRELSQTLYGFLEKEERDLFELLISVSGIGPKTALFIIGTLSFEDLEQAIQNNNIPLICKVPGIGKKTAERLVIEMRDKIHKTFASKKGSSQISQILNVKDQNLYDAMNALINLGYNQNMAKNAIRKALEHIEENFNLSQLITEALKYTNQKTMI